MWEGLLDIPIEDLHEYVTHVSFAIENVLVCIKCIGLYLKLSACVHGKCI